MSAPKWVYRLTCYDGTDPDSYLRKVERRHPGRHPGRDHKKESLLKKTDEDEAVIVLLTHMVTHSVSLPSTLHRENKEFITQINWLYIENKQQKNKKTREFHDILTRCFDFYFSKKEIKILQKYYMRPYLGFNIILFFLQLAAIMDTEENNAGVFVNEDCNPTWTAVVQRIEYIARCNAYLKQCEDKVQRKTLDFLRKVLHDRATARFKRPLEGMTGVLTHALFRKELNRVLEVNLSLTKTNSLFSYFDRNDQGVLKGDEVSKYLVNISIELLKEKPHMKLEKPTEPYIISSYDESQIDMSSSHYDGDELLNPTSQIDREDSLPSNAERKSSKSPKDIFNQSIVKISGTILQLLQQGEFVPLMLPDGYVNEPFVRTSLMNQMGIKLSILETHILCDRLRQGNENNDSPSKAKIRSEINGVNYNTDVSQSKKSYLPSIVNNATSNSCSTDDNIILGKYVKVFITSIKKICSKRLHQQVESCKPLFVK